MVTWPFPGMAINPVGAAGAEFPQPVITAMLNRRTMITEDHTLFIFISPDLLVNV
jgi:hypothetical protein